MRRVVVFDGGLGGENVANYLSSELNVIEVIRIIDWANAPYQNKPLAEICRLAETALVSFINHTDVIVLGGYVTSLALDYFRHRYPHQKFIGVGIDREYLTESKSCPDQVMMLMNNILIESEFHQAIRQHFPKSLILTPNCSNLEAMSDLGENSLENLQKELMEDGIEPEFIVLLDTHFWNLKEELATLWSWRTQVVDFRKKLLRDLCLALKLRGVDGGRPI